MKIDIKPFSINASWRGRRFKTPEYQVWRREFFYKIKEKYPYLRKRKNWVEIKYNFHISTFNKSDVDNFIKTTSDALVDAGLIVDDRWVKRYVIEKFECNEGEEFIEFEIREIEEKL